MVLSTNSCKDFESGQSDFSPTGQLVHCQSGPAIITQDTSVANYIIRSANKMGPEIIKI